MSQIYRYILLYFITILFPLNIWATGGVLTGSGTVASPYVVADYADLCVVGTTGTYSPAKVYKLANDIDASASRPEFGGSGFTPIGATSSTKFTGKFYGDGYKISNLYVNRTATYSGLFGYAYTPAIIDGVTLENCLIESTAIYTAGIVGFARGGVAISDCHVIGSSDTIRSTSDYVGGICGYSFTAIISNCSFNGYVEGSGPNGYVGGIVGYAKSSSKFENCNNYGDVVCSGNYSAGVVGDIESSLTVSNCSNSGTINGNNNTGGVIGQSKSSGDITNCYNTGRVIGTDSVGGVIGRVNGASVDSCYNSGAVSATGWYVGGVVGRMVSEVLLNCSNIADVNGLKLVGGIAGGSESSQISKCFNTGNIEATLDCGGITGNASYGSMSLCYNTGNISGNSRIGGVSGFLGSGIQVENVYTTGNVDANVTSGGFAGQVFNLVTIKNSYSTGRVTGTSGVAGFIGFVSASTFPNSYFDTVTSGFESGLSYYDVLDTTLTALNDIQMKDAGYIDRLDYVSIWSIRNDSTYPALRVFDNAPCAVVDTIYLSAKDFGIPFSLSRLLDNDFDYETIQDSLFLRVYNLSEGLTDSVNTIDLPSTIKNGDVISLEYRIGEKRAVYPDSLWGNTVASLLIMDNHIPVLHTQVYSIKVNSVTTFSFDIIDIDGDSVSLTVLDSLENGYVSFGRNNMVYYPDSNFYGYDSMRVIISDGYQKDTLWIKFSVGIPVDVNGTEVETNKMFDGNVSAKVLNNGYLLDVAAEDYGKVNLVAVANYMSASVGENKVISVNYYLTGDSAYKYIIPDGFNLFGAKISMFITLNPLGDIQTSDSNSNIYLPYTILTGEPTEFRIVYGDEAKNVGFSNVDYISLPLNNRSDSIVIQLPVGLSFGTYSASLQMRNELGVPSMMYSFKIVTCIPSVWVKLYNGQVLYVENENETFVSYQWYKDGVLIEGATSQSYIDNNGFIGSYVVKATDANGNDYYSNPKYFSEKIDLSKNIAIYPNPVKEGGVTTLAIVGYSETELADADVKVYDSRGSLCSSIVGLKTINALRITEVGGVYIVKISISGTEKIIKVIVD